MSIVFYHNEEQRHWALETRDREAARRGTAIYTEIVPASDFTLAEDYHQKYQLRGTPALMAEFSAIYPDNVDLVNSTAAARVNGYLGGNGTVEQLEAELESLGLSPETQEHLRAIASRRRR